MAAISVKTTTNNPENGIYMNTTFLVDMYQFGENCHFQQGDFPALEFQGSGTIVFKAIPWALESNPNPIFKGRNAMPSSSNVDVDAIMEAEMKAESAAESWGCR